MPDPAATAGRFQTLVNLLPIGVAVTAGPEQRLIYANPACRQLLGINKGEVVGTWSDCFEGTGADGRAYEASDWPMFRSTQSGQTVLDEEIWLHTTGGEERCLSFSTAPICDPDGNSTAAVVALFDVTTRKHVEAARIRSTRHLIKSQEDQRARLARELHDQIGQDLTALSLVLKALEDTIRSGEVGATIVALQTIIKRMSADVHHIAAGLRPARLSELGLRGALENLISSFAEIHSLNPETDLAALEGAVDEETSLTLYRVVQEALTNVARHARARTLSVSAARLDGLIRVVVEDDGIGFDPAIAETSPTGGFGLAGMRERLALVGGELAIESHPGRGTAVYASIPAPRPVARGGRP